MHRPLKLFERAGAHVKIVFERLVVFPQILLYVANPRAEITHQTLDVLHGGDDVAAKARDVAADDVHARHFAIDEAVALGPVSPTQGRQPVPDGQQQIVALGELVAVLLFKVRQFPAILRACGFKLGHARFVLLDCPRDALVASLDLVKVVPVLLPGVAFFVEKVGQSARFKAGAFKHGVSRAENAVFLGKFVSCVFEVLDGVVEVFLHFVNFLVI